MKIKTAELTGAALDWAVAKCLGIRVYIGRYEHTMTGPCLLDADLVDMNTDGPQELKFSRDWAQGGPIIEREEITIDYRDSETQARKWCDSRQNFIEARASKRQGLIAAMRCFCCSKLGEEIDIPKELLK